MGQFFNFILDNLTLCLFQICGCSFEFQLILLVWNSTKRTENYCLSLTSTWSKGIELGLATIVCRKFFWMISCKWSSIHPSFQLSIDPRKCNSSCWTGNNIDVCFKKIVTFSNFKYSQLYILKWTRNVPFPYRSIDDW